MGVDIYILSNTKVEGAISLPVIKQVFFNLDISFLDYDYLIFSSKNGVKATANICNEWKKVPSLAIGEATANEIKRLGGIVEFVSKSFYGEDFAKEIAKNFSKNKKFLFLRAKRVSTNLALLLKKEGFLIDEKIVYQTICNCNNLTPPKKGAYILFSSPSTIECFFKCFKWDESYRAFAIGKKTAAAFRGDIKIAEGKNLKECVRYIKNLV